MAAWEQVVAKMANLTQDQLLSTLPLALNTIAPPTDCVWRPDLPSCETLRRFYTLCDGGSFDNCMYRIYACSEVGSATDKWIRWLQEDGQADALIAGRHLVFGEDSAGAPLLWDAHTDQVSAYWFKGGEWEALAGSLLAFFEALFDPDANENPEWALAVEQILRTPSANGREKSIGCE